MEIKEITVENIKASFGASILLPVLFVLLLLHTNINNAFCESGNKHMFCGLLNKLKDKNLELIIRILWGLTVHITYTRRFFKKKENFTANELRSEKLQLFTRLDMKMYVWKTNELPERNGIYFIHEDDIAPYIRRDDGTIRKYWGRMFETKYYGYDFIETYGAAKKFLNSDEGYRSCPVIADYERRKKNHGKERKERVKKKEEKIRSKTPKRK